MKEEYNITRGVLLRFLRGGLAGMVATTLTIVPVVGGWADLKIWLGALAVGAIVGFISGTLQAADKYFRS